MLTINNHLLYLNNHNSIITSSLALEISLFQVSDMALDQLSVDGKKAKAEVRWRTMEVEVQMEQAEEDDGRIQTFPIEYRHFPLSIIICLV